MQQLLWVALGGSIGAVFRYLLASAIYQFTGRDFPYGTLMVNVLGSFIIGVLSIWLVEKYELSSELRLAIIVGGLGAFTTFSTFSWETIQLIEQGALIRAGLNIVLSVVLCLLGTWLGMMWARQSV